MPPLLSLQKLHGQTTGRVHLETDGAHSLNTDLSGVPKIIPEQCTGCGRCVAACPQRTFTLQQEGYRKTGVMRFSERCTLCGRCIENCPVGAIHEQYPE
jgi:ferredoxin